MVLPFSMDIGSRVHGAMVNRFGVIAPKAMFVLSISIFAFALHHILLYLLIEVVSVRLLSAKLLVIGLLFFFNYLSRSRIVFRGPSEAASIGSVPGSG